MFDEHENLSNDSTNAWTNRQQVRDESFPIEAPIARDDAQTAIPQIGRHTLGWAFHVSMSAPLKLGIQGGTQLIIAHWFVAFFRIEIALALLTGVRKSVLKILVQGTASAINGLCLTKVLPGSLCA